MSLRFYSDNADAAPVGWIAWLVRAAIGGTIAVLAGLNSGIVPLF